DDAQHLARGRLIFERFLQLALARLLRFEQPSILDGNHCLVGKRGDELDLLLAERLHFRLREGEHANRLTLAQKRDHKQRSYSSNYNLVLTTEFGIGLKIRHMHRAPFEHSSTGERGTIRGYGVIL